MGLTGRGGGEYVQFFSFPISPMFFWVWEGQLLFVLFELNQIKFPIWQYEIYVNVNIRTSCKIHKIYEGN